MRPPTFYEATPIPLGKPRTFHETKFHKTKVLTVILIFLLLNLLFLFLGGKKLGLGKVKKLHQFQTVANGVIFFQTVSKNNTIPIFEVIWGQTDGPTDGPT
jgi:hypothetical protein